MLERDAEIELSLNLVDMIGKGKCILLAGPLISLAPPGRLGPPTPAWMAFELAEDVGKQLDDYDLPRVAHRYADEEGPNALRRRVRERLDDPRYRPTLAHHLIAQLPFQRIVYTAQDSLLRRAFESHGRSASYVQPGDSVSYATDRLVILLYGSTGDPVRLKLTEDERRHVFQEHPSLAGILHSWAEQDALLVLGYVLNDPALSDLYYQLRPKSTEEIQELPRAYLVGPGLSPDQDRYWNQHNATLYGLDTHTFLQKLAENLDEKGYLPGPIDLSIQEPPLLSQQELQERYQLRAQFESQSRINEWVETSAELRRRFEPHFMIQMNIGMERTRPRSGEDMTPQTTPERDETTALNLLQSGNIELSQGNLELARAYFEEAQRRNPKLTDAYLSLYHLLIELGDLDGALKVYHDLLQAVQDPPQAFLPERYQIHEILGQVDLGVSYRVYDRVDEQFVTVTILRRTLALQEETLAQFVRQMSALSSPLISRILGFDRHRGRTYMLSEFVEGQTLRNCLSSGQALPYQEAMQIAGQIAEALEDGLQQGVPHLDLEPANVVLSSEGAKLVNYGYSRLARLAWGPGRMVDGGWSNYLSPEQIAGEEGDARSDIYAAGTILYEMLTGHTPGSGRLEHASEINVRVTEAVDVLIDHARERYPDRRFNSPGEMRAEIDRITLSSPSKHPNHYLRVGLAWISRRYEDLVSRKALAFLLSSMVVFVVLSAIPSIPYVLSSAARLLFPPLLNSVLVSLLFDWAVRAVARRKGLGSLIASGRGMGAILGLAFTFNMLFLVGFQPYFQHPEPLQNISGLLAITLFEAVAGLGMILGAAQAAERWFKDYISGFYWSFVTIVAIELLLTILRQPEGLWSLQ